MPKIHILPKDIISKIAAGEVVSNPADVVKELVENSIDASATEVHVKLLDGGAKEITVIDNGCGMSYEDLHLCYQEHATSKLFSEKDLEKISSLGFRGEALFSLCIAGDLEIKSKISDSLEGNKIYVRQGVLQDASVLGMPTGTCISVYDLFKDLPARKKFLKDTDKELKTVKSILVSIAIAYPSIRFKLSHNGNLLIDLLSTTKNLRFKDVFGKSFDKDFLEVSYVDSHFELTGFVSLPAYARKSSVANYLFINGRLVQSAVVTNAVKAAYAELLDEKKLPGFVLFLTTPLDYIDVNVHPKKEQISFLNDSSVFDFIYNGVHSTLQANDATLLKEGFLAASKYMKTYLGDMKDSLTTDLDGNLEKFLQIHDLYILEQTPKGLLLIDQHAAHERIIYEKLVALYEQKNKESVVLDTPILLELGIQDLDVLKSNQNFFYDLGFELIIDSTSCKVISVPALYLNRNLKVILLELVDDLQASIKSKKIDTRGSAALSYLACRTAIKSGEKLSQTQAAKLLDDLKKTKTQYICPHGRPAQVEIPLREIERLFMR